MITVLLPVLFGGSDLPIRDWPPPLRGLQPTSLFARHGAVEAAPSQNNFID
jgi:hypothetical protein